MDKSIPRLVVCASLIEKATNQAALCRSCEVLGVDHLILPTLDDSWTFRKIAASAQQWQSISYLPTDQLADWLTQQVHYTRVALTIDNSAQSLTQYEFSANTLLLLGRELTGIPKTITPLCDVSLKIPQYGQVESLNVHTAAAIAIYEYNRQWR
ncbi:MAG: RNA methyltransferase [Cyanobacteria bacterium P01_D01_bin.156]